MKKALQHMKALIVEEEGATAIEYALLASLIAAVIVTGVSTLGSKVAGLYSSVSSKIP